MEYNIKYEPGDFKLGYLKTTHSCPHCERPPMPSPVGCVLGKPLMIAIPPQGVHLSCPVHPEGHHIFGPQVTC